MEGIEMTAKENMMLGILEREFKTLKSISLDNIAKLRAITAKAPNEALEAIISRKIPFVDTVANSELVKRGILPQSAKMEHAINKLMANHA
jgi:hypothetical protein